MEEGEDIQELAERTRERKASRAATKLMRDLDPGSPAMEDTPRGRKSRKGKGRADGDATPAGGKRKRGVKAASVTPSIQDDDEEERDTVSVL